VVEGASGDLAKQSLDRMAAEGHVERVKKDTYNRNYNDSKVVELVALCNILGLPNNGTKDELVE
jgi:hypothetical protein